MRLSKRAISVEEAKELYEFSGPFRLDELKTKRREFQKKYHTDISGDPSTKRKSQEVNEAFDLLKELAVSSKSKKWKNPSDQDWESWDNHYVFDWVSAAKLINTRKPVKAVAGLITAWGPPEGGVIMVRRRKTLVH